MILSSKDIQIVDGIDIFFRRFKVKFAHGSWIFKRSLTEKFEFFSDKVPISDDLEGWFKSLFHGKVGILPVAVFVHRIHFDNGVVKIDHNKLIEDLILYKIVADYAIKIGFSQEEIEKWYTYNVIRQSESFISWMNSLYNKGIYSQKQLKEILYFFTKLLNEKYNLKLIQTSKKSIASLNLKFLKMFYRLLPVYNR